MLLEIEYLMSKDKKTYFSNYLHLFTPWFKKL